MDVTLPIDPFYITQTFGVNPDAYKQFGLKGHNGWDVRTKYTDTPEGRRNIFAPQDATFFKKGDEGKSGYGKFFEVTTRTSKGYWRHTFAHCHSIQTFTSKKQGEPMAVSNNTGNSTAAHLHWTVKRVNSEGVVINYNNGYFGAVNPQEYVDEVRADTNNMGTVQVDAKLYENLVNGATVRKEVAEYLKIDSPDTASKERILNVIQGIQSAVTATQRERDEAQKDLANKVAELSRVQDQLMISAKAQDELTRQAKNLQEMLDKQGKVVGGLQTRIQELETDIRELKKNVINGVDAGELLRLAILKFLRLA